MPTLAAVLRSDVRRVARGEIEKTLRALRKLQAQVTKLDRSAREQRRSLLSLERRLERLKQRRANGRGPRRGSLVPAHAIRSTRSRLKMTRVQFAKLIGVSPGSIFGWETGRSSPRSKSVVRLAEARKMGQKAAHEQVDPPRRKTGRR
jgi:DNA-binding transcriptional regulator YiaG